MKLDLRDLKPGDVFYVLEKRYAPPKKVSMLIDGEIWHKYVSAPWVYEVHRHIYHGFCVTTFHGDRDVLEQHFYDLGYKTGNSAMLFVYAHEGKPSLTSDDVDDPIRRRATTDEQYATKLCSRFNRLALHLRNSA